MDYSNKRKGISMKMSIAQKILAEYELLSQNTQELIIFFDNTGLITDCNARTMVELGYDEEIYNIPIYEIFKNAFKYEDNQLFINPIYQNILDETIAYRKNQTCFPVELKITVQNDKKLFVGLCTATNIAEQKKALLTLKHMKKELKSAHKTQNEIVANITHELRTPVNGIMGLSDNLLETALDPKQIETINLIKRCCNTMNKIVNDLLDYAKISNNKLIIEQRQFNFTEFIENIISINKIRINEKGLNLMVNFSADIPEAVIGDEYRLAQILNNLFSNAIKFTSVGQIALEVVKISQNDQFVELFFMMIDTGIGISLAEKDKLFQSFSQVDGSITRRFGGTGLGLSISKSLVEAMHGTISVDSEKGKGSTFSFSVRLGIPRYSQGKHYKSEALNNKKIVMDKKDLWNDNVHARTLYPAIDRMSVMMQETNTTFLSLKEETESKEDIRKNILTTIEKLTISIEMECWEKAEELAEHLKRIVPEEYGAISKDVFRLLLSVRKENHDISLTILNELKTAIHEVI
jgi:signal transduction histidine kinase